MMQCKSCGQYDKDGVSLLDPNHSHLLQFMVLHIHHQVETTISTFLCRDCINEVEQWRNFVNRFQSSQQHFHRVIARLEAKQDHADTTLKASKLPMCRVLVKKLLECDFCHFYTENKTELSTHMQSHHQVPYQAECRNSQGLRRKKAQANEGKKRQYKCLECGTMFIHLAAKIWHTKYCHGDNAILTVVFSNRSRIYQCKLCNFKCGRQGVALSHLHSKHKCTMPFVCNICNAQYPHQQSLTFHKFVHKNESWECKICFARFRCERDLKVHQRKTHSSCQEVKCKICQKTYKSVYTLRCHVAYSHAEQQPYKCEKCNKSFSQQLFLRQHYRTLHLKNPLQCKKCGAEFKSLGGYTEHCKYKHAKQQVSFKCEICSATFTLPRNLQTHIKYMHNSLVNSVTCTICNAKLKNKPSLYVHMKNKHLGKKKYCAHCNYSTRTRRDLINHVSCRHINVYGKQMSCNFCNAKLKNKHNLHAHVRNVHSGNIFYCDHCNYKTHSRKYIIDHLRRHDRRLGMA